MSVEARLDRLEVQHKSIDAEIHGLARVCADTKNIALTNQHDIAGLKMDVVGVKSDLAALAQATLSGFKRNDEQHEETHQKIAALTDAMLAAFIKADKQRNDFVKEVRERFERQEKRFDQLELLIRQSLPSN